MYTVVEEVRRYVIFGQEWEYAKMLNFVEEKKAKVVRELRNERVRGHRGVVVYAERLLVKPKQGRRSSRDIAREREQERREARGAA